jgi:hypothetical protein
MLSLVVAAAITITITEHIFKLCCGRIVQTTNPNLIRMLYPLARIGCLP